MSRQAGARDLGVCRAVGPVQRLPSGEQVLGWPGTRRTQVELPHVMRGLLRVMNALGKGLYVDRSIQLRLAT